MAETRELTCGYNPTHPLKFGNHHFRGITFVIGPNGSGKTTLLKTLAKLLPPLSGHIVMNSQPAFAPANWEIQSGVTGQDLYEIFSTKTSRWASLKNTQLLAVDSLLNTPLDSLSSGEAQRVLLSAVLSHPSDVAILDEPLAHLDWRYSLVLKELIESQSKDGRIFVLSAHDLNWCLQFSASQCLALDKGQVIEQGATPEVLVSTKVQSAFNFRSQLADNPLNGQHVLALAAYDKHR